ncbi:uncharacterized protein SCODWIG_00529 [Saccharomycodes ludwigii]|uniref:DNA-directed RNA polymerase I subunit RPA34 n=1 Tax=Saccharomycodes ludwigii TaxID=36035 RepID=A0A376B257_9ASCO|nr:hypothetical protein SCDLUD_002604 [Saccharomycodes ludwigii]KAH3901122.1 hypothetical protein SCDLUD_002604 [Saccharomycodes ludwigii]SSD58768.1 uncharacterized protein SCODWIG_00529 [Saccharomycodes ludwigii]
MTSVQATNTSTFKNKSKHLSKEYISDADSDDEYTGQNYADRKYEPPKNYKQVKHLKLLDKNMEHGKKEIWLIKAPVDLDISKLKSLPIDFNLSTDGNNVATHNTSIDIENNNNNALKIRSNDSSTNTSFKIREDLSQEVQNTYQLLISNNSKTAFKFENGNTSGTNKKSKNKSKTIIDKFFTITASSTIPSIDYNKVKTARSNVEQIKGLKMEHFATGYDSKDYLAEDNTDIKTSTNNTAKKHKHHKHSSSKKEHRHHSHNGKVHKDKSTSSSQKN